MSQLVLTSFVVFAFILCRKRLLHWNNVRHYDNDIDFVPIWFDLKGPKVHFLAQGNPQRERERERERHLFVWRKVKLFIPIIHSNKVTAAPTREAEWERNQEKQSHFLYSLSKKKKKSFSLYFAKPVRPRRFPILRLNRPIFTIYRF